ncbi:MAG: MFS transporter [Acidobacteriota bacterium]|nr:MFS transporter [Acidobacteriota bacterium]
MTTRHRHAPIWLMGLSNASFGLFGGFTSVVFPQLLAAQHVPETQIASLTAATFLPGLFGCFVAPILDVRYSRRLYATVLAAVASILLVCAILQQQNIPAETALLVAGFASVWLSASALGGWLSSVVPTDAKNTVSIWFQLANVCGGGTMAALALPLLRNTPPRPGALALGGLVMLPTLIFLWIPAPGPDRRLARESFAEFFGELLAMVRRRETLLAILLFAAPSSTFSLTNILGGLGHDFNATERMVSLLSGSGGVAAGIVGSSLLAPLAKRFALRPLYLGIGIVGGLFTLSLLVLPRAAETLGLAILGEGLFQALAFATLTAITMETIGHHNALAATQFGVLSSANYLPLIYMAMVDGAGYKHGGVVGSFALDAGVSIAACLLLIPVMRAFRPRQQTIAEASD